MSKEHAKQEEKKGRGKAPAFSSLRRYTWLMLLALIAAFFILAIAFVAIVSNAVIEERLRQMKHVAELIASAYEAEEYQDFSQLDLEAEKQSLDLMAESSQASLWLVDSRGRIFYVNDLPLEARNKLQVKTDGEVYMPRGILELANEDDTGLLSYKRGYFFGLFDSQGPEWISLIKSLTNEQGQVRAYLMLHYSYEDLQYSWPYVAQGVLLVILIGILVGLLMMGFYSRRMMRPIQELSEASSKVAQGDFSARVDLETFGHVPFSTAEADEELERLGKTFNRMIEQLERSNAAQRDFVSSILHDLRTPLTSIRGFVTAILDGTVPPEKNDRYLQIVYAEVERLSLLVSDMNESIRFEQGQIETIDFQVFDLRDLIIKVLESMQTLFEEKNLSVQTNLMPGLDEELLVEADKEQIKRVIYNLVSNSVKFTPREGIVAITVRAKKDLYLIDVEDSGPGIAEQDKAEIFKRFYKADKARTNTSQSGSGLGLYICQQILQQHGQHILVEDGKLGGIKFSFSLPRA